MSTQPFQGLSFLEVVEKLQEDKNFSSLFEAFALNAVVTGLNSPAGEMLLRFFAKDANELAQLVANKEALQGILTVNRRETIDTTATQTPGIGTTNSTVQCEAVGFNRASFVALLESNENASQPQQPETEQ
jgi:hypothetical protein